MRIFLSWSGDRSHRVALEIKKWLPSVLPNVTVFLSSESISKGSRWNLTLCEELERCAFGILLVTKENQSSPWLIYEAGALSKAVDGSRVIPLLLNMSPAELKLPLAQFQAASATRDELLRILKSIADTDPTSQVDEQTLRERLKVWWPHLENFFKEAMAESVLLSRPARALLPSETSWINEIIASDPQNASFAIGDAVVFDQSNFGTGYRGENIRIGYSDIPYDLPADLKEIADRYRSSQIGRDLPHYVITSFKHSEIDYPDVILTLARCWYMDIRSLQAALQDRPGQIVGNAGTTLIDRLISMGPLDLNRTPLPSQLSVNVAVILQPAGEDAHLLIVQRGPRTQVGYYPEAWSVSVQETMSAGSGVQAEAAHEADASLQACAVRGVREELLGAGLPDFSVELNSFFIEAPLLNQSVMAIARVRLSFDRVCQQRRYLAGDSRESGLVCAVPCRPESLLRLLNASEFDLEYVRTVGKIDRQARNQSVNSVRTWHPSSRLAIFSALRRYFPDQARTWLLSEIEKMA